MKNNITPVAILLGSIIISLSIIYYANNDAFSKCVKLVMEDTFHSPSSAAQICIKKK
tara:strand:- start:221 stop:391 length:171 start_codon:yes stop_codon:yes gene_type:complete